MIINFPYKILIERSVEGEIEALLKEMRLGKKIAMICNENVGRVIGFKIKDILSNSFDVEIIKPESIEKKYLERLSEKIKQFDFTIGLGGGRSIDAAKYSSFLAKKPWIAFPTALSHDGVVSSRASITSNGFRTSVDATEPIAIIGDLDTIKKAPYRLIASGAGDLISNISAVEDWKLAAEKGKEKYHTLMAELALLSSRGVINHIDDIREKNYHGLEILLWSLICSGFAMNIYGSSRPCSGSEHNFSHALDSLGANALHGEQCALGTIVMTYLQGQRKACKTTEGEKRNGPTPVRDLRGDVWQKVRDMMIRLGLPTNSKEIGIKEDILIDALVNAKRVRERYTVLNEINITRAEAEKILEAVKII